MIIIGITGTIGAGKGTVVEYLIQKKNFRHYSVRTFLIDIIRQRGMEVNRDSMVEIANELRLKFGPAYIVEQLYLKAFKEGDHTIIESIRTPGEIDLLQTKQNFYLLAVDADSKIRYERIVNRNSETDQISFDTFIENEKREMHTDDPNKQNLSKCIERADFIIQNNHGFNELYMQIERFFSKITDKE
ncbi:MAG: AAA family ATPase [Bacteroidales bacterium]|nr:AAA family ATPase [Bacteroidales bacterium]